MSLLKLVLPPNGVDSSSFTDKEAYFENNANLTDDIFHSALELEHAGDLCVFAKNPPLFMQKSFNVTCAVLDLYVVLTPLLNILALTVVVHFSPPPGSLRDKTWTGVLQLPLSLW